MKNCTNFLYPIKLASSFSIVGLLKILQVSFSYQSLEVLFRLEEFINFEFLADYFDCKFFFSFIPL